MHLWTCVIPFVKEEVELICGETAAAGEVSKRWKSGCRCSMGTVKLRMRTGLLIGFNVIC